MAPAPGGKGMAAEIRRINKGKKPHEPVYDPELLPAGSIIAVDISTILVPFVKSNEGAAQSNALPAQSVTSIKDKLEVVLMKKIAPFNHKMLCVVDGSFLFKDEVVRHKRNKIVTDGLSKLAAARSAEVFSDALIKQVRRAEKNASKVTCDVIANVIKWTQRRPGITAVIGSPFEADAQCSHLVRLGIADAAGTTDSDLYVFGCPLILYVHLTTSKKLGAMVRTGKTCSSDINAMTPIQLAWLVCLCGCDYIDNLHGCGIKKAIKVVQAWKMMSEQVPKVCVQCVLLCDCSAYSVTSFSPLITGSTV